MPPGQIEIALHDVAVGGQDLGSVEAFADGDHAGLAGAELLFEARVTTVFADEAVVPEIEQIIILVAIEAERALDLRS